MNDAWTDRWNERYSKEGYAYGEHPNQFLKEQLDQLPTGNILFPAEGEGRNAVYAARNGWTVAAFDISAEGKRKAMQLAATHGVEIDYRLGTLETAGFTPAQFDAIALIYAHFPAAVKSAIHRSLDQYLRPGGILIFEAFSKQHLNYLAKNEEIGGPKEIDMLFSIEEIKLDFPHYDYLLLEEKEIELHEGEFHNGIGSVIRFVGRKK